MICQKQAIIKKGFEKEEGVFVHALDTVLSSFNVQHQAYHGGSFIRNQIHTTLKACIKFTPILITLQLNNIATLCNSVIETAKTHDLSLLSDAKAISEKFHIALTLFSKCHKLYDEIKTFSETNIRELGHLIHFCHTLQLRIYCLNPASNVSKGNIYSKASYVRESYSALDQDIKDWLWSDGRTGSRVSTCAIQLNGKGLQQYERPGRENESS